MCQHLCYQQTAFYKKYVIMLVLNTSISSFKTLLLSYKEILRFVNVLKASKAYSKKVCVGRYRRFKRWPDGMNTPCVSYRTVQSEELACFKHITGICRPSRKMSNKIIFCFEFDFSDQFLKQSGINFIPLPLLNLYDIEKNHRYA